MKVKVEPQISPLAFYFGIHPPFGAGKESREIRQATLAIRRKILKGLTRRIRRAFLELR
jgi:hypothetical protein